MVSTMFNLEAQFGERRDDTLRRECFDNVGKLYND